MLRFLILCLFIQTAAAETFGGINFPDGSVSFADVVVSYNHFSQWWARSHPWHEP